MTVDVAPDTHPPVIGSVVADPAVLWPPNHQMVRVRLTVTVTDNVTPAPACEVTSVGSSESGDGRGDGRTGADWQVTGPLEVALRAERSGRGSGRIYTLTVTCRDQAGHESHAHAAVLVPYSR